MSMKRKEDSERILAKLDELARSYKHESRSWWPEYVFHFSALENVTSILRSGFLYSRNEVTKLALLHSDTASRSVLANTSSSYKDYVRLYFRPKTPTQYSNEGIRPHGSLKYDAHCPVPVMLLFDSRDILTRETTKYSKGSLAGRGPRSVGTSASFFEKLPFKKIYHNSYLKESKKQEIITSRHAEVIVPNRLSLNALKFIWCRSEAEKETLISLLDEEQRNRWIRKIFHGQKYDLFFLCWSYIEEARLNKNGVQFRFNRSTKTPGPFDLSAYVKDHDNNETLSAEESGVMLDHTILLKFKRPIENYVVELRVDDHLVYRSEHEDVDNIF